MGPNSFNASNNGGTREMSCGQMGEVFSDILVNDLG